MLPRYETIADSVNIADLTDEKFKTFRVSVHLIVPLNREIAAQNAVLTPMVARVTREFPDYTAMSRHLAKLYGASLSSSVSRIGDNQLLSLSVSGISKKYAFGGENPEQELVSLLCSAVFRPYLTENGLFPEESFAQEQRQLLETIDADFNDKKIYAKERCLQELFRREPAGVSHNGTSEEVKALDPALLPRQWRQVLKKAVVQIYVTGSCDFAAVRESFRQEFVFPREPERLSNCKLPAGELRELTEEMNVVQSKLVLGFRAPKVPAAPFRIMAVLYGGSPSSKLFLNVREKESLCYYCSARAGSVKGSLFVESGVETQKLEAARAAILEQLEEVRRGNFTPEELTFAKLSMINGLSAVGDSLYSLEGFYLNRMFEPKLLTPEEEIEALEAVTPEQVAEAARETVLDTVFTLRGR